MDEINRKLNYWLIEVVDDEINILDDEDDYNINYSEIGVNVVLKWDLTHLNFTWEDIDNNIMIKNNDRYYFFHESFIPSKAEMEKISDEIKIAIIVDGKIKNIDDNFNLN